MAPELAAKGKKACPASIVSARPLFVAVSVQGGAALHFAHWGGCSACQFDEALALRASRSKFGNSF